MDVTIFADSQIFFFYDDVKKIVFTWQHFVVWNTTQTHVRTLIIEKRTYKKNKIVDTTC